MIRIGDLFQSEQFQMIQRQFALWSIGVTGVLIVLLICQIALRWSSFTLILCAMIGALAFYLIVKPEADKPGAKAGFFCLQANIVISLLLLLNDAFLGVLTQVSENVALTGLWNLVYMFDIGLLIATVAVLRQEPILEQLEQLRDGNIATVLQGQGAETVEPGDAVLGYLVDENGKKTNKPVILPAKDRFLHMLILGPTGSGKTSQSIIPMINRDIQNPELGIIALEPKGDLAEKIFAMARHYDREVVYFNPVLPDCPYFNPLFGREIDVVENMATTFNMLNADAPQFFKDMTDGLIRKSVKLLKRVYGDDATLLDLNALIWNTKTRDDSPGDGLELVNKLKMVKTSDPAIEKENLEIISWFINDYFAGISGKMGAPKTFEHCSGARSQISKLVSNQYLRRVLNPPRGHGSDLDFDNALATGKIVTMGTAAGDLRELGRFLGYFIILQLQASVFRRPGNEFTRRHCMLYIDEFQVYSNPGFADMLTMGRSYRVASHLATQARAQIGMGSGKDGKGFIELVSTNARNKIIYPGVSATDAKYYADEFGEVLKRKEDRSYAKKRFFSTFDDERVTIKVDEKMGARFSPSDIIYKPFGQITYCIIKKNSIQPPGVSQIEYIPYELNEKLDQMVADYNAEQLTKRESIFNASTPAIPDEAIDALHEVHPEDVELAEIELAENEIDGDMLGLSIALNDDDF